MKIYGKPYKVKIYGFPYGKVYMKNDGPLEITNINTAAKAALAIKRIRKLKNISQEELARMINMRQGTISDIEKGKGTLDSFFKIIQVLKVDLTMSDPKSQKKRSSDSKVQKVLNLLRDIE